MEVLFFHEDVERFIRSLESGTMAKVLRVIDLLEDFGSNLKMPHSKPIVDGVFELRIRGIQEVRILYTFHRSSAVLLVGFLKKSDKVPLREIQTATRRKLALD